MYGAVGRIRISVMALSQTEHSGDTTPFVGVLALQGAYEAHAARLRALGARTLLVKRPDQLGEIDGLVVPGGESTTMLKHLERAGFFDLLQAFVRTKPTFGTCAGAILLAKEVRNPEQRSLGVLDVVIERNAYGRQNDSRILETVTTLPGGPLETVYIRAPRITAAGPGVTTLAKRDGDATLVRQDHLLAATFHPELSPDTRVHSLFLDMVRDACRIS